MNVKSDAMWVGTKSERTADMVATQGDVTRLRVIVEGKRAFDIGGGATFTPKRRGGASPRRRRRGDRHRARDGRGVELRRGAAHRRRPSADAGRARGVRIRGVGRERGDAHHAQRVRAGTDVEHRAPMGPHGKRHRAAVVRADATALGTDRVFEGDARLALDAGYGVGVGHAGCSRRTQDSRSGMREAARCAPGPAGRWVRTRCSD